jgi:uncharacterized protein with HEPN domain
VSRDLTLLLEDIEASCSRILRFAAGLTREETFRDEMRSDAILHNFLVLGEAVKVLPADWRAKHPDVEWRTIAGLRDVVAHTYFALDLGILWDAIQEEIPPLLERVRALLREERGEGR